VGRSYHSNLAFLDILFNTLLCFVALFAIALLIVSPEKESSEIDVRAEFIITASWPGDRNDDIDIYVEDPEGNVVFFRNQEAGMMHLDRDDLGVDPYSSSISESIDNSDNREIVMIRGMMPGEYVVNIHAYIKRTEGETPVLVTIDKINPFGTVSSRTLLMRYSGQEETACRFILDREGRVIGTNSIPKYFTGIGW